jgi:hypothetical protein
MTDFCDDFRAGVLNCRYVVPLPLRARYVIIALIDRSRGLSNGSGSRP